MPDVRILFFNVKADDVAEVRAKLSRQIDRMRRPVSERLSDLCEAATEIIENQKEQAVTAAIKAVAGRLNTFLLGNGELGARKQHAYQEALRTVRGVRYPSTLWASARRSGEYSGLNIVHQVGVGAVKDAQLRWRDWFTRIEGHVNELKADPDLSPAKRSIEQIREVAESSGRVFLASAQRSAMEIYREPLTQAPVWSQCAREWGRGRASGTGFISICRSGSRNIRTSKERWMAG